MVRRPRRSTRFPYTTLFRSIGNTARLGAQRRLESEAIFVFILREVLSLAGVMLLLCIAHADPPLLPRSIDTFRAVALQDRKSTRLNSSHSQTSYAVFCLKKK